MGSKRRGPPDGWGGGHRGGMRPRPLLLQYRHTTQHPQDRLSNNNNNNHNHNLALRHRPSASFNSNDPWNRDEMPPCTSRTPNAWNRSTAPVDDGFNPNNGFRPNFSSTLHHPRFGNRCISYPHHRNPSPFQWNAPPRPLLPLPLPQNLPHRDDKKNVDNKSDDKPLDESICDTIDRVKRKLKERKLSESYAERDTLSFDAVVEEPLSSKLNEKKRIEHVKTSPKVSIAKKICKKDDDEKLKNITTTTSPAKPDRHQKSQALRKNILKQLFKLDTHNLQRILSNPDASNKYNVVVSSLIKDTRNSISKELRSVAEKSLQFHNISANSEQGEKIVQDAFLGHLETMLDKSASLELLNMDPQIVHELSKVLQQDLMGSSSDDVCIANLRDVMQESFMEETRDNMCSVDNMFLNNVYFDDGNVEKSINLEKAYNEFELQIKVESNCEERTDDILPNSSDILKSASIDVGSLEFEKRLQSIKIENDKFTFSKIPFPFNSLLPVKEEPPSNTADDFREQILKNFDMATNKYENSNNNDKKNRKRKRFDSISDNKKEPAMDSCFTDIHVPEKSSKSKNNIKTADIPIESTICDIENIPMPSATLTNVEESSLLSSRKFENITSKRNIPENFLSQSPSWNVASEIIYSDKEVYKKDTNKFESCKNNRIIPNLPVYSSNNVSQRGENFLTSTFSNSIQNWDIIPCDIRFDKNLENKTQVAMKKDDYKIPDDCKRLNERDLYIESNTKHSTNNINFPSPGVRDFSQNYEYSREKNVDYVKPHNKTENTFSKKHTSNNYPQNQQTSAKEHKPKVSMNQYKQLNEKFPIVSQSKSVDSENDHKTTFEVKSLITEKLKEPLIEKQENKKSDSKASKKMTTKPENDKSNYYPPKRNMRNQGTQYIDFKKVNSSTQIYASLISCKSKGVQTFKINMQDVHSRTTMHISQDNSKNIKEYKETTNRGCQTDLELEKTPVTLVNKEVQVVIVSEKDKDLSPIKSSSNKSDVLSRMKFIDNEIQRLIQERSELYKSLESNPNKKYAKEDVKPSFKIYSNVNVIESKSNIDVKVRNSREKSNDSLHSNSSLNNKIKSFKNVSALNSNKKKESKKYSHNEKKVSEKSEGSFDKTNKTSSAKDGKIVVNNKEINELSENRIKALETSNSYNSSNVDVRNNLPFNNKRKSESFNCLDHHTTSNANNKLNNSKDTLQNKIVCKRKSKKQSDNSKNLSTNIRKTPLSTMISELGTDDEMSDINDEIGHILQDECHIRKDTLLPDLFKKYNLKNCSVRLEPIDSKLYSSFESRKKSGKCIKDLTNLTNNDNSISLDDICDVEFENLTDPDIPSMLENIQGNETMVLIDNWDSRLFDNVTLSESVDVFVDESDVKEVNVTTSVTADESNSKCVTKVSKIQEFPAESDISEKNAIILNDHTDSVMAIECVGSAFLAASLDGNIYHYCANSGELIRKFHCSDLAVTCLCVLNTEMYTGSFDSYLKCYNLNDGNELCNHNVGSAIQSMTVAWNTIYIGTKTGFVVKYDLNRKSLIPDGSIKVSDQTILAINAVKEGPRKVLLIAARSQDVTVKDAETGLLLRTFHGPNTTVYSLLLNSGKVFCGTSSSQIQAFDFVTGELFKLYNGGNGAVCLKIHNGLLFAGCYDGFIYVFRPDDDKPFATIPGPGKMLLAMEILDNKMIAGCKDKSLQIWDIPQIVIKEMIVKSDK